MDNAPTTREFTTRKGLAWGMKLYYKEGYVLTGNGHNDSWTAEAIEGAIEIPNNLIGGYQYTSQVRKVIDILDNGGIILLRADHKALKLSILANYLPL